MFVMQNNSLLTLPNEHNVTCFGQCSLKAGRLLVFYNFYHFFMLKQDTFSSSLIAANVYFSR